MNLADECLASPGLRVLVVSPTPARSRQLALAALNRCRAVPTAEPVWAEGGPACRIRLGNGSVLGFLFETGSDGCVAFGQGRGRYWDRRVFDSGVDGNAEALVWTRVPLYADTPRPAEAVAG